MRWEKFEKLRKASDIFDDTVRYLRRYTRGVETFAAFVSLLYFVRLQLTWSRRYKAMQEVLAELTPHICATPWATRSPPSASLVVSRSRRFRAQNLRPRGALIWAINTCAPHASLSILTSAHNLTGPPKRPLFAQVLATLQLIVLTRFAARCQTQIEKAAASHKKPKIDKSLPSFAFPDDLEYSEDEPDKGFMKSPFLLRVSNWLIDRTS